MSRRRYILVTRPDRIALLPMGHRIPPPRMLSFESGSHAPARGALRSADVDVG